MERMRITKSTSATYILFFIWFILVILNLKNTNSFTFFFIWLFLLMISIFYANFNKVGIDIELSKDQFWWVIFISYTFIISFINQKINLANVNLVRNIISYFLAFLAIYSFSRFCNLEKFIKIYRNFFAVCSILGVIEIISRRSLFSNWLESSNAIDLFNEFNINSGLYRVTLFFYHPIYYGILLTVFLIFIILNPYRSRILQYLFIFLGMINLIYTQSRSSWVTLLLCLFIYFFKSSISLNKLKVKALTKYVCMFIGVVVIISIIAILFSKLTANILYIFSSRLSEATSNTNNARTANWALVQYSNTPFLKLFGGGDGYATSMLHLHPQFMGWTQAVDNQYLTFYMDYGLVGIGIFLIFMFNVFKSFIITEDKLKIAVLLSIIAIFISSFFYEVYFQNEINNLLFILICFLNLNSRKKF